jgi:hypothetical protein
MPAVEQVLPGELTVHVRVHEVATAQGAVPCWSFITEGMKALRQQEVVFTLRRNEQEGPDDYPPAVPDLFRSVFELAKNGEYVEAGGWTEFQALYFLGRADVAGLLYLPAQEVPGLELPPDCLLATMLVGDELMAVQSFGPMRVAALLGNAFRFYPWPAWFDRTRASVVALREMEQSSLLATLPRGSLYHCARVRKQQENIVLSLLPEARAEIPLLLDQVPREQPLAMLTNLDPEANGCLVWQPGQSGAAGIAPENSDGSRPSGAFLAFVPAQEHNQGQIFEDGFTMSLTAAAWNVVREGLKAAHPLHVPGSPGWFSLSVEWVS